MEDHIHTFIPSFPLSRRFLHFLQSLSPFLLCALLRPDGRISPVVAIRFPSVASVRQGSSAIVVVDDEDGRRFLSRRRVGLWRERRTPDNCYTPRVAIAFGNRSPLTPIVANKFRPRFMTLESLSR